jgi:hypothetical protein
LRLGGGVDRPHHLVDELAVGEGIALDGRLAQQLVVDPRIGHALRDLLADGDLRLADHVGEPRDREFLGGRRGDDVDVRGEGLLEPIARGESADRERGGRPEEVHCGVLW